MNSMTPSQWLDVAVLAVAFIAAISGWVASWTPSFQTVTRRVMVMLLR